MISIVIPLYNKEQSIVRTLDSVFAQTYKDYEVVIVNDGSTDHSQHVVEEYIQSHITNYAGDESKIRLISKPNGGVSSARNRGIREAKGEYIAFLDADDLWEPEYLQVLNRLILDFPDCGLYLLGCVETHDGTIPMLEEHPRRGIVENPWNNPVNCTCASSCTSSRTLLLKINGFDERMTHGEDYDVWWRLAFNYGVAVDERTLIYYRQDAENRVTNEYIPLQKHIPFYIEKFQKERKKSEDFRKFFDAQMVYRLYPYLFNSKYRDDVYQLSKMIDYSQLKWSMHFRMVCPHLYRLYERLKNIL